jgi:hypothetical protein
MRVSPWPCPGPPTIGATGDDATDPRSRARAPPRALSEPERAAVLADRDLDRMLAWQNRADGALVLARWALGASLSSLVAVALQVLATVGHAMNGGIP